MRDKYRYIIYVLLFLFLCIYSLDRAMMGVVGSTIVSGMPQRDDHNLVVAAMTKVLGVDAPVLE